MIISYDIFRVTVPHDQCVVLALMPEMLRIDTETNRLIAAIQVTLRIRTGYRISRIEVVRRALSAMAGDLNIPEIPKRGTEKGTQEVIETLKMMKLRTAAALVDSAVSETFTFYAYPPQHWLKIKTNNPMERLLREVRRRTRVVGAFPDSHAALMLVSARLRHVSATKWGTHKYIIRAKQPAPFIVDILQG